MNGIVSAILIVFAVFAVVGLIILAIEIIHAPMDTELWPNDHNNKEE